MNAETQAQLEKIRKVSKVVRIVCKIFLWLIPIAYLVGVVSIIIGTKIVTINIWRTEIPASQLTTTSKVLVIIFSALVFAVIFKGLYHLRRLFANYADGNVFTAGSIAQIRQLGITFMLAAGLKFLAIPFGAVLMLLCVPDEVTCSFETSMFPFAELIMGGLVFLIAWVMDIGRGLREENELTV